MPRIRHEENHLHTANAIKAAAREEMKASGTAGLTLRGIARRMHITAPAVYNYYPRLEDLITALIVDAFNDLADAMQAAGQSVTSATWAPKIKATILAYRQWAVAHPVEFQLIYGNPIPGYAAPPEVTAPLANRPFTILYGYFYEALKAWEMSIPPEYRSTPPNIKAYITDANRSLGAQFQPDLFYLLVVGWSRIHGIVMLELFNHLQPVVGKPEEFYLHEVTALMTSCRLKA
jgi:AcrR family transcriptional regulator